MLMNFSFLCATLCFTIATADNIVKIVTFFSSFFISSLCIMIWTLNTVVKLQLRHQNLNETNSDYELLHTMYATTLSSHRRISIDVGLSAIDLTEGSAL